MMRHVIATVLALFVLTIVLALGCNLPAANDLDASPERPRDPRPFELLDPDCRLTPLGALHVASRGLAWESENARQLCLLRSAVHRWAGDLEGRLVLIPGDNCGKR